MYAVVSILDEPNYQRLEALWRELETGCGLAGISLTPLPHLSWHIAAEYDLKHLEAELDTLAAASQPFMVRTAGLGIFTGSSPVLFIQVVKTPGLAAFHRQVWERVDATAAGPSAHYDPDGWVPHITLAYGDVIPERLGCAVENLVLRPFQWEIQIDHLALVYQSSGQVGKLQRRFVFGGDA